MVIDTCNDFEYNPAQGKGSFSSKHSQKPLNEQDLCMHGGIFSDQRCPACNSRFKDDRKRGLFCPNHPEHCATRFVVRFKDITRRFTDYTSAQRFLTGLRFQSDRKIFDSRDFKKDKPLGFSNLAHQWLAIKKGTVKPKSFANIRNYLQRAIDKWKDTNIKVLDYAEIEDLLTYHRKPPSDSKWKPLSPKSISNMKSVLHSFWTWFSRRERKKNPLYQMPDFPETPFELEFRRIVGKATQGMIIDEVYRLTYSLNPKIWLGIKWLATYYSIRPGELVRIKEQDIDLENGYITIPHPKEKKVKTVPIIDADVDIIKSLPKGFPSMSFFRHLPGISGCTAGEPFGEKYFYKWWKKACANLGIEGVDLYGGTRHSTARALRKEGRTPEEIKRGSMHATNKAFDRYFQVEGDDLRDIYADAVPPQKMAPADNGLITKKKGGQGEIQKAKILKLKR